MKIAIGCDHGGYLLKQDILIWLEEHDYEFEDFGCYNTESVDYPVYGEKVARASASPCPPTRSRVSAAPCAATATAPR